VRKMTVVATIARRISGWLGGAGLPDAVTTRVFAAMNQSSFRNYADAGGTA
jgi:hypothetical protein